MKIFMREIFQTVIQLCKIVFKGKFKIIKRFSWTLQGRWNRFTISNIC